MEIFVLLPFILTAAILLVNIFAAVTSCYRVPLAGDIVEDSDGKCYAVLASSVSGDELELQEVDKDTFDAVFYAEPVHKKSCEVTVIHVNMDNPFRRS